MKKKIIVVFLIMFSLGVNKVYSASNYKGMLNANGEKITDSLKCGEAYYFGKLVNYYKPSSNENYCCPSADSVVSSRTNTISVDDLFKLDDDNMAVLEIVTNNNNNTCSYELYKHIDGSSTSIVINEDVKITDLDDKETKYIYALPSSAPIKNDEFKEGCYYDEVQSKNIYGKYTIQQYVISQPNTIKNYNKNQCLNLDSPDKSEPSQPNNPNNSSTTTDSTNNATKNPQTGGKIVFFVSLSLIIILLIVFSYKMYEEKRTNIK